MRVRDKGYTKKSPFPIIEVFKPKIIERKGDNMANANNSLSHSKWMCKYHIVFTPKYRRKPESNLGLIYALISGLSFLPLNVFNS